MTFKIGGFLVKKVMINQGSGAEIMYSDLYKGLGLKDKDLTKYHTQIVGFNKKMVMPIRQIKLLVVTEKKEVMVNFIVIHAFLLYTMILEWPWIQAMGVVPSILHLKVKFPTEHKIVVVKEIRT